jgi:hypothetical protein
VLLASYVVVSVQCFSGFHMLIKVCREPDPSHIPYKATGNKSTNNKCACGVQSLIIFACSLERISSHSSVPDEWNWGKNHITYWKEYVNIFPEDEIWQAIQNFKSGHDQPGQVGLLGKLVWALVWQGMNCHMKAWDHVFERYIIARIIDPRTITCSSPLFHQVITMASEASQITWIM